MGPRTYSGNHAACSYCTHTVTTAEATPDAGRGSMNLFVLKTWLESKFANDERGANLVEYILLVALIALVVIGAVTIFQKKVSGKFSDASTGLN
jgi:Flp pilus assembly pilin Flp